MCERRSSEVLGVRTPTTRPASPVTLDRQLASLVVHRAQGPAKRGVLFVVGVAMQVVRRRSRHLVHPQTRLRSHRVLPTASPIHVAVQLLRSESTSFATANPMRRSSVYSNVAVVARKVATTVGAPPECLATFLA